MIVEINAVGNEYGITCNFLYLRRNFRQRGCIADHEIINPREAGNEIWDFAFRVDQGGEFIKNLPAISFEDGNLGDLIALDSVTRRFYIYYRIHQSKL